MPKDLCLALPIQAPRKAWAALAVKHADACPADGASAHVAAAHLGCVRLALVGNVRHLSRLTEPQDVTLLRPVHGSVTVTLKQESATAVPGRLLLFGPGKRTMAMSEDFHGLLTLLPMASVGDTLMALAQDLVPPGLETPIVLDLAEPASAQLDWFLLELVRQLGETGATRTERWTPNAASQAILALVAGAVMASAAAPSAVAPPWPLRQAEELLRARMHEPLSMADVCRELQLSERALQLAFRRHRGMSPMQFRRECRLERAREQLLDAAGNQNVTAIAHECGLSHAGRFAAAYRARYGELPLATLLRSRGGRHAAPSPGRRRK